MVQCCGPLEIVCVFTKINRKHYLQDCIYYQALRVPDTYSAEVSLVLAYPLHLWRVQNRYIMGHDSFCLFLVLFLSSVKALRNQMISSIEFRSKSNLFWIQKKNMSLHLQTKGSGTSATCGDFQHLPD